MSGYKWPLLHEDSSNFLGTTIKFIITSFFEKKAHNVLHSTTFPTNKHHDKIKRQMLSFLSINQ